jgi:hypothetical protein
MTKKLIVLRWLPASWKSSFAISEVSKANAIRFTKDDIRKAKSPEFLIHETKLLDKWVISLEDNQI